MRKIGDIVKAAGTVATIASARAAYGDGVVLYALTNDNGVTFFVFDEDCISDASHEEKLDFVGNQVKRERREVLTNDDLDDYIDFSWAIRFCDA